MPDDDVGRLEKDIERLVHDRSRTTKPMERFVLNQRIKRIRQKINEMQPPEPLPA